MVQMGFLTLREAFELFYEPRREHRRYNFIGPFHPDHPIELNILAHEFGEVFKRGELLLYLENVTTGRIDRLEKCQWPETLWCRPLALYSSINDPLRTGVVDPRQPRYHGLQPRVCEADFMTWHHALAVAGGAAALTEESHPALTGSAPVKKPSTEQLVTAYTEYVAQKLAKGSPSSIDDDYNHMRCKFPVAGITLKRVRQLRKEHAPSQWQQPGRKRCAKLIKEID